MKVSVVIPCYNMGAYLADAIDSVSNQTFTDWELIVVNDGSTDAPTISALEQLETDFKNNSKLKVIHQKNSGLAAARNAGIKAAKGDYITCLDADDKLASNYLESTAARLEEDTDEAYGFVTTWLQEFGVRNDLWKTSDYDPAGMLMNNLVHAASFFRKKVWDEVGGYKKMKIGGYEDWEFWLSIIEKGYRWTIIKEPLFLYRIRENSMLAGAKEAHLHIYEELYELHPSLFKKYAKELDLANARQIKQLREYIAEERQLLSARDEEVQNLREQNEELHAQAIDMGAELSNLRHSKIISKAITLRDLAGKTRHAVRKTSPRHVAHKVRVIGAPYIPGIARRKIKEPVVAMKHRIRNARMQTIAVANASWGTQAPLVSVVIPFYNKADTLSDTLASLSVQSFRNFEVIIVDDGSSQPLNEAAIKGQFRAELKLQFIKQRNKGVAEARNMGIKAAAGKYILCLDPDDLLDSTFIEKGLLVLETSPDISLATTDVEVFGVRQEFETKTPYDPVTLFEDNMVITAAIFTKAAWQSAEGYKSDLGYEDWEFWINLAERGFWGRRIPEPLFKYRTADQSRYVEDRSKHWNNLHRIRSLHPQYRRRIKRLLARKRHIAYELEANTALINFNRTSSYRLVNKNKPRVLLALPWLTFGGAETLIVNFCQEIKDSFDLSIITGLESRHEWEYRFKELTQNIYHLSNLFGQNKELYLEFISNYIETRAIDAIHIIHTDFMFDLLPELKRRHPELKVILTLFNDRASHFDKSLPVQNYIDVFSSDNSKVADHYNRVLDERHPTVVIPNGINCYDIYNPAKFDRDKQRAELNIDDDDLAVFFIGRISEEKNPDVFVEVARELVVKKNSKKLRFFVIGDGVLGRQIETAIEKLKSAQVTYLGYQTEIARYLSAADIFVLPSSVEGFPLSLLEAMAMNVAVVASDVGAVSEIVASGQDGFVVTPGSAKEIAAAIETLQADQHLLKDMKKRARDKIEHKYSNILLGQNYKKLYTGAMGSKEEK